MVSDALRSGGGWEFAGLASGIELADMVVCLLDSRTRCVRGFGVVEDVLQKSRWNDGTNGSYTSSHNDGE